METHTAQPGKKGPCRQRFGNANPAFRALVSEMIIEPFCSIPLKNNLRLKNKTISLRVLTPNRGLGAVRKIKSALFNL